MLPFDTGAYDALPVSVLIYETLTGEDGAVQDFRIVYGNDAYAREWRASHKSPDFLGRMLLGEHLWNQETIDRMIAFRTQPPQPFSTFLPETDRHLHFQPLTIDDRFAGFFITNITEYEESTSRAHFLRNIRTLKNKAVLLRRTDEGTFEPVFCSDDFARMMEGTVEEAAAYMRGDGFLTSTHPEDRPLVAEMLRTHANDAGGSDLTIRKRTLTGRYVWTTSHYAFVDDFRERYLYCTYFDVTMFKEYEGQLRSMYEGIGGDFRRMEQDTLALFRVNLTRDTVEEVGGADLFDCDRAESSYSRLLARRAVHYPIHAEQVRFLVTFGINDLLVNFLEGRTQLSQTLYSRRQGGRQRFVNCSASLTRHPISGDIIAFISEQEYNSEKVNEAMLQKILAQQFDMITYIVDEQYGVVIGDADAKKAGNIFPAERNGVYMDYIRRQVIPVAVGDREALLEALSLDRIAEELAVREPYVVDITCEIGGAQYEKRFVFYAIDPEARFYILLKSDYTEVQREQAERNRQLKEALEEANQASVAKTAFLSRMSHEIRTPMNAIIGLDSIALQSPDLTPELKEHLDKIGVSAKYLLSLINDILDMSRIESGRMTLKNEEFSFRAFLEQINTLIYSQCQDRGLQYDCAVRGTVDEGYIGDAMKLKQVLINILGNAVNFTQSPGSVSLEVERIVRTEQQSTLRFVVRDTGIGMDEAYLPRIFDPFSQEDASNTTGYGGSGLGLAISKNIVELMNGTISVASQKGVGSTFTVDVMLKNTERHSEDREEVYLRPEDLRVLIVDDDPIACRHAQIVLEEVGIASEFCLSGAEALSLIELRHARREDYNLLLIDLRMPEQDGVSLTREIRRRIGSRSAIIILTAYSWADVEEEAIAAGVDSFLRKPLFGSSVTDEFQRALNRKRSAAAEAAEPVSLAGRRVLLAEDMLINAEIMEQLLAMRGVATERAENGQLALELFSSRPAGWFDAILMDVRMPVMDGLAATEAIRALDRPDSRTIPIIAMTANAFDEDVQRSLRAGMDAHLSKPVEPERLYETLVSFLRQRKEGGT